MLIKKNSGTKTSKPTKQNRSIADQKIIQRYTSHYDLIIRLETPFVWKNVPNFTKYEVSIDGQVRNTWTFKKIFKLNTDKEYYTVGLHGDGETTTYLVHRLVALAFIPNPENLPEVDHIDNNKLNNHVTNLRWVTQKQNIQAFNDNFREKRIILQYDLTGKLIKKWNNMTQLLEENPTYRGGAIYYNIKKPRSNTYGYRWKCDPPIVRIKADPKEKFEPITNYKNYDFSYYGISKDGKVINYEKNNIMKNTKRIDGYITAKLFCKKLKITISCRIHKLVAHVYIINNNPTHKTQVNHIDKNRSNNNYTNLEWVTPQTNIIHAVGKMVKMIDVDTNEIIKIFKCASDARRYFGKTSETHIGHVCNGKSKTCYGYKWEWVKKGEVIDEPIITIPLEKYNL